MFWDRVAWAYDIFAEGINRKADRALCTAVERLIAPSDAVVAANVIHLLDQPYQALRQLEQVCRPGGRLISGTYGLWRPVLIFGLGAVGSFLYYFMVKALHADIDAKYRKTKIVQYLCGIFTVAVALAIHLWSATLAWFAAYLGPRIGAEAAVAAVTAYQDDMLTAILPMYIPMVLFIGIHFVMLLTGKTRYPRWMLVFHPVT